eukprot:scaffold29738_cov129-Isochrysis_galbana.AAC.5
MVTDSASVRAADGAAMGRALPGMNQHHHHPTQQCRQSGAAAARLLSRGATGSSLSPDLPADVAANDDIASEHGTRRHVRVDQVRHNRGGHGELDRGGVDDADHVAGAGGLEDAKKRPVEAVLGVELDDLLVVVGTLQQLDAGVEWPAIRLEKHLHAVDGRLKRVRAERPTLDGLRSLQAVVRRRLDLIGDNIGGERELQLADIAQGDCVGPAGGLNDGAEGAQLAILHSSMSASSGRPSVLRCTCTCSTDGERYDQVRSDPPCTKISVSFELAGLLRTTPPPSPGLVLTGEDCCPCSCMSGDANRSVGAPASCGANSKPGHATSRLRCIISRRARQSSNGALIVHRRDRADPLPPQASAREFFCCSAPRLTTREEPTPHRRLMS